MNAPLESWPATELTCPSCEAVCPRGAKACWLCKSELDGGKEHAITTDKAGSDAPSAISIVMSLMPMTVTMAIVAVGVFFVAPGIGFLLAIVFAVGLIALKKELYIGRPESRANSAVAGVNIALKILSVVLSSIIAVVLSTVAVIILSIISLIAAIGSFFETCSEMLRSQ